MAENERGILFLIYSGILTRHHWLYTMYIHLQGVKKTQTQVLSNSTSDFGKHSISYHPLPRQAAGISSGL